MFGAKEAGMKISSPVPHVQRPQELVLRPSDDWSRGSRPHTSEGPPFERPPDAPVAQAGITAGKEELVIGGVSHVWVKHQSTDRGQLMW